MQKERELLVGRQMERRGSSLSWVDVVEGLSGLFALWKGCSPMCARTVSPLAAHSTNMTRLVGDRRSGAICSHHRTYSTCKRVSRSGGGNEMFLHVCMYVCKLEIDLGVHEAAFVATARILGEKKDVRVIRHVSSHDAASSY